MNRYKFYITLFFTVTLMNGCRQKEISDIYEYMRYLNDPDNGLASVRYINGLKISAKYLPEDYLAYQEIKGKKYPREYKDSLQQYYKKSKTFLLVIGPDDRKEISKGDIMYKNIENFGDYADRNLALNFDMAEYVSLSTSNNTYKPVLAGFENAYGLTPEKSIHLVFAPDKGGSDLYTSEKYDLVFNDLIFESGIHHFQFKRTDLDNAVRLNF